MPIPTQEEIEAKLRSEDLDSWLDMWRLEQGPAKPGALKLMAAVIPFPVDRPLRLLDLGCGTGDAGRAVHSRFPRAQIDSVDRNEFFAALCGAVNHRDGIGGQTVVRDLAAPDWWRDLESDFDVMLAVNVVHWFSLERAAELFRQIFQLLRPGGIFLLMEPVAAEPPFSPGFDAWRKEQPSQHNFENWRRFWTRVKALIGYDYGFLGDPPDNLDRIGDKLSAMAWVDLLRGAGFQSIDILLRDSEKILFACVKP